MFEYSQLPKLLLVLPFSLYSKSKNAVTNDFCIRFKVVIQMQLFSSDSLSLKCLFLFTLSISWRSQQKNWKTFSQFSNFKPTFLHIYGVQFYYPDHNRKLSNWRRKMDNKIFSSLVQIFDGLNVPKLFKKLIPTDYRTLFFLTRRTISLNKLSTDNCNFGGVFDWKVVLFIVCVRIPFVQIRSQIQRIFLSRCWNPDLSSTTSWISFFRVWSSNFLAKEVHWNWNLLDFSAFKLWLFCIAKKQLMFLTRSVYTTNFAQSTDFFFYYKFSIWTLLFLNRFLDFELKDSVYCLGVLRPRERQKGKRFGRPLTLDSEVS